MVQRKVTKNPGNGIRGDHLIPQKLANGSNKCTELKNNMKKSRSIKLSDVEGLRPSSPSRKTIAQPGKPPPLNVLSPAVATPHKKSMIKAVDGSPNYMKSTSSSKAKKVSFPNFLTGSNSKNLHIRSSTGSKTSSGSCNKPASLILLRTLRKSPSFKTARASAKQCSKVALFADMNNVHGATCSSTLKDSKFPPYLMLNHGTESEGTSVFKVCPYTYCSLNGHHRTPVPPLKCFLKAKRRSMKTQRSMNMEALSPRRGKPSGDGTVHTSNGVDSDISSSPLMKEEDILFIECVSETAAEHDIDTLVSESLSEGSPHSEFDFDEHFEHCDEIISKIDDGITKTLHEELKNLTEGDEQEGVSSVDVDLDHSMFDVIDIEWEEWQFSASEPDYEARSSMESDLDIGDSSESQRNDLHDEFLISSDESDINAAKEVSANGTEQFIEEDIADTDTCSQVSETFQIANNAIIDENFPSHDHLSDSQLKNAQVVDNHTALEEDQDEATFSFTRSNNAEEELPDDNHNNRKWTIGYKRHEDNCEEEKKFNPREPNFLPVVPDPDAEKVDLRHQMMDERKNAEEWMLDHALRQAVTKLAPARKRKVALLVEAFETVLPVTKCENQLRHTSTSL